MKPANLFVFLGSVVAVPVVMLFFFHLLLYTFQPQAPDDLKDAGEWIWRYLLDDPSLRLPNTDLLDMRSRRHMLDVKRILVELRHIWWGVTATFLLLFLLQWRKRLRLAQTLCWSGYIGLGTLLAGGMLAVLNFRWAFIMLHYLLFSGMTWVFPADSVLIRLFPLNYFQQFFIYWVAACTAGFIVMVWWGRVLAKKSG